MKNYITLNSECESAPLYINQYPKTTHYNDLKGTNNKTLQVQKKPQHTENNSKKEQKNDTKK
ncbi:hypothetical protein SOASR029_19720 [Budvicia aquatica]|nr:hypothetical protein SOASR029_19720 [Budvicia aquatica]